MKNILKVLCVDDDKVTLLNIAAAVEADSLFESKAILASTAEAALEILKKNSEIDLIITDQYFRNNTMMSGTTLLNELKIKFPKIVRVIISTDPRINEENIADADPDYEIYKGEDIDSRINTIIKEEFTKKQIESKKSEDG